MTVKKICLIAEGNLNWVAGFIYNNNIIHAIQMRYPDIAIDLVLNPRGSEKYFQTGSSGNLRLHYYAYYQRATFVRKIMGTVYALLKGRKVLSAERLIELIDPDFIYPSIHNLGNYPTAYWIPDLQHCVLPEFFPGDQLEERDCETREMIGISKYIVVSSENARMHLQKYYETTGKKIRVLTYTAFFDENLFSTNPLLVIGQYKLPEKFFIFSSNFWKHKNHLNLFRALNIAKEEIPEIKLVLTGSMNDYRNPGFKDELLTFIDKHHLKQHVRILGLIPRSDQVQLLRQSVAIVQPSYFEGWSSLVEDARAIGKRIILSDIPIHREQEPFEGTFFDPDNAKELAGQLVDVWLREKPGPSPEKEHWARTENKNRLRMFAERFITIAEEIKNDESKK